MKNRLMKGSLAALVSRSYECNGSKGSRFTPLSKLTFLRNTSLRLKDNPDIKIKCSRFNRYHDGEIAGRKEQPQAEVVWGLLARQWHCLKMKVFFNLTHQKAWKSCTRT